jgi:hypothetical protein
MDAPRAEPPDRASIPDGWEGKWPPCAEAQADGVPCEEVDRDCEDCDKAYPEITESAGTSKPDP